MSFDALAWAAKQKPGNLAAKMCLLALANYANDAGEAYPSTAAIAEFGDMNHKTATVALDRLEALGLISDTGRKSGRSGQIKVYRLNLQSHPKTEASQNREPPKFSGKATQKRVVEDPQKRVTDTVREPVKEPVNDDANASEAPRAEIDEGSEQKLKPEHVVEAWNDLADRIGRPKIRALTPERRQAVKARINGYSVDDFQEVLTNIERSPFLSGEKGRFCTFDWITKKANFQKILEGNYNS